MILRRLASIVFSGSIGVAALAGCSSGTDTTKATEVATSVAAAGGVSSTDAAITEAAATDAPGAADSAAQIPTPGPVAAVPTVPILIGPGGIADVRIGDDVDPTIKRLTELLGPPTSDSGWGPQQSPCENMGTRERSVSWNTFTVFFATGPTENVKNAGDHMSAYLLFEGDGEDGASADPKRFVLSDQKPVLGRTLADLKVLSPKAQRFDSEIEGPVWLLGDGPNDLSGGLSTDAADGVERTTTARAGLFCID
jgi:hypothetical protein